jgi:threonylcarbamoyladenosine tRNA methylthiotransferase MtaB
LSAQTITLGCRLNFAESETMRALAGDDTIIVNSCAVTNEAVRQTRQAIRRAHREAPEKRIIVTGCAAQLDPEAFAAMPEVARVVGNAEKYQAEAYQFPSVLSPSKDCPSFLGPEGQDSPSTSLRTNGLGSKVQVSDVMAAPVPPVAAGFLSRVRSFVAVQSG